ncbi:Vitamin B6 transporter [Taxawa tesnikishii (nom. ined.)]|nr:Vitamin B6 transporter [Dothideales sp. JES 119]
MEEPQLRRRSVIPDVEKVAPVLVPQHDLAEDSADSQQVRGWRGWIKSFERTMAYYNLEARGIQRVMPDERHDLRSLGYTQISVLWFSINLAANNITLGMLGPAVYYLSFTDASLLAVFGALVGCLPVAYIATFGPRSGNRSMVFARCRWTDPLCRLPNGSLSVIVGIVIVAVLTWGVTTFGYSILHYYERYAWAPQIVVLCILAGVAGPHFDLTTPSSGDNELTIIGDRLSFFSLCLSAAITYAGGAADFFVYYPESTARWKVFTVTMVGLLLSFTFAFVLGIGLGSGIATVPAWNSAYEVSQGALIVAGYAPWAPLDPSAASSVDFQVLGRFFMAVPRVVWNTVGVIIYTVCAIAGRQNLAEIFTNFLALMGYWVSIWIAISLEEHLVFRKWSGLGWNWDAWNSKEKLPVGAAALIAFLIGWAGAILCMAQVWYIGPIAAEVGDYGGDMGNYVGFAWAALVYPPLRWLEIKRFGR